ncbi:Thioesterase/thiol ester dehydrase-isomerase [Rhizoclosmatium globosum]|uniref:Thioesterase/thiol ester dehydrase-isomerase n=1 Tax=Rhizoclosmatium globosum TaxID=329046 RepID=A0A1Y2CRU8_9FUNG|nr:Thioesterase/thiol ester dehydrase-isomerase [Rhizoclosmatium globosum]|eukprot:ORY49769.1 Thioesterase/thiol ester dehydrase-isomerase [Rhizoclosmatium globosum]
MSDSFVQVFLPFRQDASLRDEYSSHFGKIRVGKVLEDLDALGGYIAYLHVVGASIPLAVVTASVDRMDMHGELPVDRDVSLSGHVSYVGKSSMEVTIKVMAVLPESGITLADMDSIKFLKTPLPASALSDQLILTAKFIMVSLDPATQRPSPSPQLILETDAEKELFALGAAHKSRKLQSAQNSLAQHPPTPSELSLVHTLYKEYMQYLDPSTGKQKPENVTWMEDTKLQNTVLTFPQDRNLHNKIFGGHLMRLAFELGYLAGAMFSKRPLQFVALDDIAFKRQVEVGSVLDLIANVVYSTEEGKMVVRVKAYVVQIGDAEKTKFLSNEFWITFVSIGGVEGKKMRVLPKSYEECMGYLEGKRRLEGPTVGN